MRNALSSAPRNEELAKRFLSSKVGAKCYVVGRNDQSRELIEKCAIAGVIDDFDQTNSHWSGKPIVHSKNIPFDAVVANCSTSISPQDVEKNLTRAGVRNIVAFSDLARIAPREIQQPWFVTQQRMEMERHLHEWAQLYLTLCDSRSRQTLLDVVRYRLTADPRYMQGYKVRLNEQYFESFLDPNRQVFVDAGGFDGDTTEEFCKRYPDYRKVFLFEPSPTNMASAKRRLAGFRDIEYGD